MFTCTQYDLVFTNSTAFEASNISCSWANISLAFPTTILNLSLMIALTTSRDRKKPCNVLLLNLAITDLLTGLISMPGFFVIFRYMAEGKPPCVFANIILPFVMLTSVESLLTVTCIAIERYISIFHPFFHISKLSSRNVTLCIGISWLFSIAGVAPLFAGVSSTKLFISNGTVVIIGMTLNLYCYSRLLLWAWKVRRQIKNEGARFGHTIVSSSDSRHIRLGFLIIVSMILCFAAELSNHFSLIIGHKIKGLGNIRCWKWTLILVNSFINPFITCSFCPNIRKEVIKILTCRVFCKR